MSEPRRIIPQNTSIVHVPEAELLIADALRIIQNEMTRFAMQSRTGKALSLSEARVLQGYIKSLVELSKENRERAKADDLSNMSNEEMLELAKMLVSKSAQNVAPGDTKKNATE